MLFLLRDKIFPRYPYIDALRCFAILIVIACHSSQSAPLSPSYFRLLIDQGQRGVQLFFVVSAFTLLLAWNARHEKILSFYIRRLFRIAPMFWLSIFLYLWLFGLGNRYWAPEGIRFSNIFYTFFFLHGWSPFNFNGVIDGGWSVGVEMMFYLIFPLLVFFIRGWQASFLFLLASCIFSYFALNLTFEHYLDIWPYIAKDHEYTVWNLVNLWLPTQIPVFAFGFLLYYSVKIFDGKISPTFNYLLAIFSLFLMTYLAFRPDPYSIFYGKITIYTVYAACFSLFAFTLSQGAFKWMVNPLSCYIGKISYSLYLLHFAVLNVFTGEIKNLIEHLIPELGFGWCYFISFYLCVVLISVLASTITYFLIEKPSIAFGNRILINAIKSRS